VQTYNKDKSRLLTVNISGVTIDGDGVLCRGRRRLPRRAGLDLEVQDHQPS